MKLLTIAAAIALSACSPPNLEDTKAAACDRWAEVGYQCIGYEGYQWGLWLGDSYGGAKVWHTLRRPEAPNVIYSGYVKKWGSEYHIYGPRAVDAIQGN